jgi:hypothetical protein
MIRGENERSDGEGQVANTPYLLASVMETLYSISASNYLLGQGMMIPEPDHVDQDVEEDEKLTAGFSGEGH